jgi:hypothetical protein
MEVLLLTGTIFAVVLIAYRLFQSERPGGTPGLGLFSFKATPTLAPERKERRNA